MSVEIENDKNIFYRHLIDEMDKHSFSSYSFQTLNDLYLLSIGNCESLNLSTWKRLSTDSIKLLNDADFEFYRVYIKTYTN